MGGILWEESTGRNPVGGILQGGILRGRNNTVGGIIWGGTFGEQSCGRNPTGRKSTATVGMIKKWVQFSILQNLKL